MKVSGIILAGGLSSRMGKDKTLLKYQDETIIEHAVREMRKVADEIIIASNHTSKYDIPSTVEVADIYPNMGPLGGMHAGLSAASNTLTMIMAADMPFFRAELAQFLLARSADYDVVVPEIKGRWEPLCAVYSRNCIPAIEKCLLADIRQIFQFYSEMKVRKISEVDLAYLGKAEDLFYNVNTPQDYQKLTSQK